ncbi:hypothetical protein [Hamadaea tsunoensis]|uniref:hypothetical protein n=1 Tax=Hamadaea tsunoensis TaxID=53368 RepID=UPI0003FBD267|nr:hypothetical protein [Hamadaea tsunoensis]
MPLSRPARAAAVTLAAALLLVVGRPAAAAPQALSKCTPTSGVILAVDFGHWGGPLLRACGTTPTTGYELLNQGGWKTAGTQHDGPGFVCRIGYSGYQSGTQFPTAADDKCVLTPPATAYWSYWHADPGQDSWSYSQLGAIGYHPKPGSVDLWTFGATGDGGTSGRPSFSPDRVRAHAAASPSPAAPKPPASSPAGRAPTSTRPSTVVSAATATPAATGTAGPSPSLSTEAATPGTQASIVDAEPAADPPANPDGGSALPLILTAGLLALAGLATAVVVRRRRAGPPDA